MINYNIINNLTNNNSEKFEMDLELDESTKDFSNKSFYSNSYNSDLSKMNDSYDLKQNNLNDFYEKNKNYIDEIKNVFINLEINEIIRLVKIINLKENVIMFEIINFLHCENEISEFKKFIESKKNYFNERIYERRYNLFEKEIDSNLKEIMLNLEINDSDIKKRRNLKKDSYNFYNYYPILIKKNKKKDFDIFFSNNELEYNFHPLKYKTKICRDPYCKFKNINYLFCNKSHNIEKDFRIIFDLKNEKICKLMNILSKWNFLHIDNYLNYYKIPTEFNLSDFKIFKCIYDSKCLKDSHLCLMAHKNEEIRRPPFLFKYNNKECPYAKIKKKDYQPEKCPFGIFCPNVHNRFEFNYHPNNFRKCFECTRDVDNNGKCIFYKTCYGRHKYDNENNNKEYKKEDVYIEEKNGVFIKYDVDNDNFNKKFENKIKKCENIMKIFVCKNCGLLPKNHCFYFLKCHHILCNDCFKKIKNNINKCPQCNIEIEENNFFQIKFSKK